MHWHWQTARVQTAAEVLVLVVVTPFRTEPRRRGLKSASGSTTRGCQWSGLDDLSAQPEADMMMQI
eukprot:2343770-Rhodomonas_salina.7